MTHKSRHICLALALVNMLTALFGCVHALADFLSKAVNYARRLPQFPILLRE
jgi:hypothetical protein